MIRIPLSSIALLAFTLVASSCTPTKFVGSFFEADEYQKTLASINFVDQNGVSETISNPDRLQQYATVDFLSNQPYQKVLLVWRRNPEGNIAATCISYHPNGQPKQYLEIINGRALGAYQEWHSNGQLKVLSNIIGGTGDFYPGVEKTWLFEGEAYAWNDQGILLATIPYAKGCLEGISLYYHECGALWRKVPMSAGLVDGVEEVFFRDGSPFQISTYKAGKRNGITKRFWGNGQIAVEETYLNDRLQEATYTSIDCNIISRISQGNGFRAEFGQKSLKELQQYVNGVQEGIVQFYSKQGILLRTSHYKDGVKDGDEYEFFPDSNLPKLLIQWNKGKIHGSVKSWYPDGILESQREMAGNQKMGILMTWYADSSLMVLEEYDQDKLVRGEYYSQGCSAPISIVKDGKGIATFHLPDGRFLRKTKYRAGQPELE